MSTADTIALYSAIFAGCAFLAALGAVWYSKRTLDFAVFTTRLAKNEELERIRLDILNDITRNRSTMEKTRLEIGAIRATFNASPQKVRDQLPSYEGLFNVMLPKIELGIKHYDEMWGSLNEAATNLSYHTLMSQRANLYQWWADEEIHMRSMQVMIDEFQDHLLAAHNKLSSPMVVNI